MSTRKSTRVPKPSEAVRASAIAGKNQQQPKATGKRKQPPKSTGSKRNTQRSRTAPQAAEQIADNSHPDQENRDEGGPEEQISNMEQQMRSMLQELLPSIIKYTREMDEEDRQNQDLPNQENHYDEQIQGNTESLPKAGEMAWKKFGARIAVSVGVVAQAIVTLAGLAVAATAKLLSSSKL